MLCFRKWGSYFHLLNLSKRLSNILWWHCYSCTLIVGHLLWSFNQCVFIWNMKDPLKLYFSYYPLFGMVLKPTIFLDPLQHLLRCLRHLQSLSRISKLGKSSLNHVLLMFIRIFNVLKKGLMVLYVKNGFHNNGANSILVGWRITYYSRKLTFLISIRNMFMLLGN